MNKNLYLFSILFVVCGFSVGASQVLAATTSPLSPVGNGFYKSWEGSYRNINEAVSKPSCSEGDHVNGYISTNEANTRESSIINLSSIPAGSVIVGVEVQAADRGGSKAGGTYATFIRFNGVNSLNGATHTVVGTSGGCTNTRTDTFNTNNTVKSNSTSLEIGVVKTRDRGQGNNEVRVGAMAAVVTYTTPVLTTNQNISITTNAPTSASYNSTFGVAATSDSGLVVAISATGGCSGSGSGSATITMTSGTTSCVVHYNQAGNSSFNAAPELTETTSATKATTSLLVTPYTIPYEGGSFSLTATLSPAVSGKTISFYLIDPSISGTTIAFTNSGGIAIVNGMNAGGVINAGDYPAGIIASFAGDTNYAASSTTSDLNITKLDQTIVFGTINDKTYGDPDFSVSGYASSGLPITFSTSTPGVCSVSGFTAHIIGVGSCTITTSTQAGDVNYNPTPGVSETFNINPLPVVLSGSRPYDGTTSIAAGILSILNIVGSDDVSVVSGSGTVPDANFFGGQSLASFGDLTLGGTSANNYTLTGATSYINIVAPAP